MTASPTPEPAAAPPLPVWRYAGRLAPLAVLWAVLVGLLAWLLYTRAGWNEESDRADVREWLDNTRVFRKTLTELVRDYIDLVRTDAPGFGHADRVRDKRTEIEEHLRAMVEPTRMYAGQLPVFPSVYTIEVEFAEVSGAPEPVEPLRWVSPKPRPGGPAKAQLRTLEYEPNVGRDGARVTLRCVYQLHSFNRMQKQQDEYRFWQTLAAAVLVPSTLFAVYMVVRFLRRERARELDKWRAAAEAEHRQRELLAAQVERELIERSLLESRVKQQEAERASEELGRKLLEQELSAAKLAGRAAEAEREALEMKSQLYASIGIMAGSYAHNIKNLLVRPNDLITRCMESANGDVEQQSMLSEVRQTLGTVTERLQQILRTVRRDPASAEVTQVDVNALFRETQRTWAEMGRDKWKLLVTADVPDGPALVRGDLSHLQQAVENLVFNARDATFEMRNHLRDEAKRETDASARRKKLLDAAGWRGEVHLRARAEGDRVVLEVRDNGIGMTEEVRNNCLKTHFTTKRDNALYEGYSAGMGLGLSFVAMVLEHHGGTLEIESAPLRGTTFRVRFPLAAAAAA
jgi:signal transduction histidine kinase